MTLFLVRETLLQTHAAGSWWPSCPQRSPTPISPELLPRWLSPSLQRYMVLFHPTCSILLLTSLMMFVVYRLLVTYNFSRSLWMAAVPFRSLTAFSSLVLSINLLRIHSVPPPGLLLKALSRIGAVIDHWGTPLVTDHQLDFSPPIAGLQFHQLSQFPTHHFVCLYNPYLPNSMIRRPWEIVQKTSLKSMCTTSTCFLLATVPITSLQKAVRKVRCDFHMVNLEKQVNPGKELQDDLTVAFLYVEGTYRKD